MKDRELIELENRAKNGLLAGAGAFAITALSCYRISQEMYYEPDFGKAMKLSGIMAGVAAATWFCMPAAANPVEDHIEEVKTTLTAPVKVLLNQVLRSQRASVADMQQARDRYYNSRPTQTAGGWTFVGSQRQDSYTRGYEKATTRSMFDNSTSDDYDPLDDEDLEDFYKTLDDE